jgi:hypothetical protein
VPKPIARLTLRSENGVRLRIFRRDSVVGSDKKTEPAEAAPGGSGCPFPH